MTTDCRNPKSVGALERAGREPSVAVRGNGSVAGLLMSGSADLQIGATVRKAPAQTDQEIGPPTVPGNQPNQRCCSTLGTGRRAAAGSVAPRGLGFLPRVRRHVCPIFTAVALAAGTLPGSSVIRELKQLDVDFTQAASATNGATWSEPDKLTITTNGLGWDGEPAALRDGWIQTKPLAVGLTWRTPRGVSVRVAIRPAPVEITLHNGQKTTPYRGDVFVRYSPDKAHWSSWQVLQAAEAQSTEEKRTPGRFFSAMVQVPRAESDHYGDLLSQYAKLDVPWTSDEEAAVKWMLDREPDFFAKQLPFIGYLEFRFEGGFHGGQRIRSFHADVSYGMSGLASVPRADARKDRDAGPWRYEAGTPKAVQPRTP